MAYLSRRFALPDAQSPLDIAQAISRLLWSYNRNIPASERSPRQEIWEHLDPDGYKQVFLYIEDHLLDVRYAEIRGRDQVALERDISSIRASLPLYDMDDVFERICASPTAAALVKLTSELFVTAPDDYDAHAYALLKAQLQHPNQHVQQAAIFACTYVSWPELRQPLEAIATQPGPVAEEARKVISALERHTWSPGRS